MRHFILVALATIGSLASSVAAAAPLPVPIALPLLSQDIEAMGREVGSPERLAEVLAILDNIVVYPASESGSQPSANPADGSIEPPAVVTFVAAPYFTADPTAASVGEQVIARDSLKLLDAYDQLLRASGAPAWELLALAHAVEGMGHRGAAVAKAASAFADLRVAALLGGEVSAAMAYANGLTALEAVARRLFGQLSTNDRRSIVAATMGLADRLNVILDANDFLLAQTDFVGLVFRLLPRFRASVAKLTLGYRTATFVGGFDARQRDALALYRRIRPEVRIESLSADVGVHPVAQTATSLYALGGVAPSVMMIRGVNLHTGGMCGNAQACTVVLEYTEVGARSALLATTGASLFPVTFFGRIVGEPRRPTCRLIFAASASDTPSAGTPLPFPTDLLDGLDAPSVLQPAAVEGSTCTEAEAAAILNESYFGLLHERAQRSRAVRRTFARNAAERWMTAVAVPAAKSVPSPSSPMALPTQLGLPIGLEGGSALSRTILALPPAIRSLALDAISDRRFAAEWPLVPEVTLREIVLVDTGAMGTIELPFDGAPIVCWRPGFPEPVMAACPANLASGADTQLSVSEAASTACAPGADVTECSDSINNGPVNDGGFIDVFAGL